MKLVATRVDIEIKDAFYRFCKRLGMKPSVLLTSLIDVYGRSEILIEKMEKGEVSKAEVLMELGRIVADMQKLSRANGEFKKAVDNLLERHGISFGDLGLTQ